jgi:hypothetical protein
MNILLKKVSEYFVHLLLYILQRKFPEGNVNLRREIIIYQRTCSWLSPWESWHAAGVTERVLEPSPTRLTPGHLHPEGEASDAEPMRETIILHMDEKISAVIRLRIFHVAKS